MIIDYTDRISFKTHSYKRFGKYIEKLARWNKLSEKQKIEIVEKNRVESIKQCEKAKKKNLEENARLCSMRNKVVAWTPPTPNHKNLKDFMLEQIKISMHDLSYYTKEIINLQTRSTKSLIANKTEDLKDGVEYHKKELEKETIRYNGNNDWLEQLYKSVGR